MTTKVSKRKFFRRVITIEVLSEEEVNETTSLSQLEYAMTDGDCSINIEWGKSQIVDAKKMAKLLIKQGSDPSFFMLKDKGEDISI